MLLKPCCQTGDLVILETIQREVTAALEPMGSKVFAQNETVADLEHSANDHIHQLAHLQAKHAMVATQVDFLSRKCED